ncbi:MAG: beta-glucosidase [Acidimicrobiia bacterium]
MSEFSEAATRVAAGADPVAEATAMVAALTVDEIVDLLDGDVPFWPGLTDMTSGGYYRHAWPAACNERLGIPGFAFTDGPRGVVIGNATCFPVAMARAATFDLELEEEVGRVIGVEARAAGATYFGGVCVNLLRHPAWGRAQETYGEDPYQLGEFGAALTRGVQEHVLACVKHFACNSMENARFTLDVQADDRALHEVYLPHFRRVVEEGVASVMSSYNSLNGEWAGQSAALLTGVLREEWGFDGFVITDFIFGLRDPVLSVRAGLDVEMPFAQQRARSLRAALIVGTITREELSAPATRVVATLLRFADRVSAPAPPVDVLAAPEHRALARRVAQESVVMLTNRDALLPVDPATVCRVAVLGRLASVPNLGDGGSSAVHPPSVVTPLDGLRAAFPEAIVDHSDADATIARKADLVIVVVGYTKADEGEYIESGNAALFELFPPVDDPRVGNRAPMPPLPPAPLAAELSADEATMAEGGDRRSLRLGDEDEALVEAVSAVNPRTVVAVMSGSAVVMPWIDGPASTLLLWYPGMEGGHALADVITGAVPPSGRLPFAIPHAESDLVHFDPDATTEVYGLFHGQWHLDRVGTAPAFPFGFGASTTTFALDGLHVGSAHDVVSVGVANTGGRDGVTVVQVYAGYETSAYERPAWRLVGFRRVELGQGGRVHVEVPVDLRMLEVRVDGAMVREPGAVVVRAAFDASDPGVRATVTL